MSSSSSLEFTLELRKIRHGRPFTLTNLETNLASLETVQDAPILLERSLILCATCSARMSCFDASPLLDLFVPE